MKSLAIELGPYNVKVNAINTQEDINTIMYRAGQASVIDYIKQKQTEDEI